MTCELPDCATEIDERELLAELCETYPDFQDVANALCARHSAGLIDGDLVDAFYRANGREWAGWPA